MATGLAAVVFCTLSWTDAPSSSAATRAVPDAEQPLDARTLAELDDTPRCACDGSKSSWGQVTVAGIAVPVGGDAGDRGRPLEARTSLAAYRYPSWFRSRAPPQQA